MGEVGALSPVDARNVLMIRSPDLTVNLAEARQGPMLGAGALGPIRSLSLCLIIYKLRLT